MGWEIGMSFRGFASVVSVILDEASWLLLLYNLIHWDFGFQVGSRVGQIGIASGIVANPGSKVSYSILHIRWAKGLSTDQ